MNLNSIKKTLPAILVLIGCLSCINDENTQSELELIESEKFNGNNVAIFKSFDLLVSNYRANENLSNDEISNLFLKSVKESGGTLIEIPKGDRNTNRRKEDDFSPEFKNFIGELENLTDSQNSEEYKNQLGDVRSQILEINFDIEEKEILLSKIIFLNDFVI